MNTKLMLVKVHNFILLTLHVDLEINDANNLVTWFLLGK